jgi:hypothetical protein
MRTHMGSKYMGIGIAMGLAVGGTLGLVLDNPLAWLGLGAAAGVAVGFGTAIAKAARSKA